MFIPGHEYRRSDIHDEFKGNRQSGISIPADGNLIFLFSSPRGVDYGYSDGFTEDGSYYYTGEGTKGDMDFTSNNQGIQDYIKNGKDIHLFEQTRKGYVRYVGQMILRGHHFESGPDSEKFIRRKIIFELIPIENVVPDVFYGNDPIENQVNSSLTMDELRNKAIENTSQSVSSRESIVKIRERSQAIRLYALARAQGICEYCNEKSPFLTRYNAPYLEVHHIRRLSDGGPDDPDWVAALCPNCHRKAHYSKKHKSVNEELHKIVREKEKSSI